MTPKKILPTQTHLKAPRVEAAKKLLFLTHADVQTDPEVPIPKWGLSETGKARHTAFNKIATPLNIEEIYTSNEQKAIDGAVIMAEHLNIPFTVITALHENDRSSTGYLPPIEFEATADEFFASPATSVRGWEKARDAQQRIVTAISGIINSGNTSATIAVVAHGGVGALLMSHVTKQPISRSLDQPATKGGNYFLFHTHNNQLIHGWKTIVAE